ncbi:VOC family protein [Bhargavaea beijingensis]|uniref:VOC family protein n=1 Tax=Bhargavaea beijingensis TaxID=426756 RepID=A0A1G7GCT6_9BACL|nr:VOC family protein [Bhargavaea beijingensis]MCW1929000.1 VOC family protein [Bhargavaea beijingensis]RSK34385.1 VOC family protein [Bhargavaea beijingensis]SDE85809.1 hypothetical protein SAMN04488126_12528 [Bhargavaea beijingensis]
MNRINLLTLGVSNMTASLRFYRDGLGFETSVTEDNPGIVFFKNGGTRLALYPLEELEKDIDAAGPQTKSGFSGMTIAYNAKSEEEVDAVMEQACQAGGKVLKKPERVFWGGYSGYFSDPDGYVWEVAYGPNWQFDEQDMLIID